MAKPKKENDGKSKHPGGRPSKYTKELAQKICLAISKSTIGLKRMCRENPEFPNADTIMEWKFAYPEFSVQYKAAKLLQADNFAEDIIDIADDDSQDAIINDYGNVVQNAEFIARSRLRMDARKWIASRLLPKVYGDKSEVTTNIEDENIKAAIAEIRSAVDIIKSFERDY